MFLFSNRSASFAAARFFASPLRSLLVASLGGCALCAALPHLAHAAPAADTSCAFVTQSGAAGFAQTRVHQAVFRPTDNASLVASSANIMHFFLIDSTHHMPIWNGGFRLTIIASPTDRMMVLSYLAMLTELDGSCRELPSTALAGRSAKIFENRPDSKSNEVVLKVWIDAASGLPMRVDLLSTAQPVAPSEVKNSLPRLSTSVAFLYGDAVKAPRTDPQQQTRPRQALDPQTLANLLAMLN